MVIRIMLEMAVHVPRLCHVIQSAAFGANPKVTVQVFQNTTYHIVAKAVGIGAMRVVLEGGDMPVIDTDAAIIRADPHRSALILENGADGVIAERELVVIFGGEGIEAFFRRIVIEAVDGTDPKAAKAIFDNGTDVVVG